MQYLFGNVFNGCGFSEGYLGIENGIITETGDGKPPERPFAEGVITPGLVNAHTHSADGLLTFSGTPSIKELVMPPNGMKHVYLRNAPHHELIMSMRSFTDIMFRTGTTGFIDFREGGREGVELIRIAAPAPHGMILGRPHGVDDVDDVLDAADGIGLSSISDIPKKDLDHIADRVHRKGKKLGIHVSERIREDIERVVSLSPSFVVHMVEASDADMRACADNDIPIVSCPRSNIFFGKIPPLDRMVDSGADIAIGTDNAMLCVPDMREEARVFNDILYAKGVDNAHTIHSLLNSCRKVLYGSEGFPLSKGMPADIAVFRHSGGGPTDSILSSGTDTIMTALGRTVI